MDRLILENHLSPGDIVTLTAAVRDLHKSHPGRFVTDVRTACPALWENNPYLTPLSPDEPGVRTILCHYPSIHFCHQSPDHFLVGFMNFLNDELDLRIRPTAFKGDIHLSESERERPSIVEQTLGRPVPYWIIAAGGKYDYTIKWWHRRRWQKVVDHFRDRLLFVQVGEAGHFHPPLQGVLDLRGRTTIRELIHLMYRADGVVCPVTLLMHLAAAVPLPPGRRRLRSCVVVAGGREPAHWEQYPGHHYLHTIGALECCAAGGCWRSRIVPLGDGSALDSPDALCVDVTSGGLPRCMEMITPEAVCQAIELSLSANPSHQPNQHSIHHDQTKDQA